MKDDFKEQSTELIKDIVVMEEIVSINGKLKLLNTKALTLQAIALHEIALELKRQNDLKEKK